MRNAHIPAVINSIIARCAAGSGGNAAELARARFGEREAYVTKSTIEAGGLSSGNWATPLAIPEWQEFFTSVEQLSVVGRAGLRVVPLNVRIGSVAEPMSAYWPGRAQPKPLSKLVLSGDTLLPQTVVVVTVITKEMSRHQHPAGAQLLNIELSRTIADGIDAAFLDPDNAGDP